MLDADKLGKRIKQARRAKRITAEAFAEKAEISVGFLREIERGSKKPSIAKFVDIANALEVSADDLLKDSVAASEPLVLQGIARELEGLPADRAAFIEQVVKVMKDEFNNRK